MLTSQEAAELLRMKPETVAMKANKGLIQGVKVGRAWLFRKATIDGILAGTRPDPEPSPPER